MFEMVPSCVRAGDFSPCLSVVAQFVQNLAPKAQNGVLLSENPNGFAYGSHFKARLVERKMIMGDIINVLHKGKIFADAEYENGQWRYRVSTFKMTVVFAFINPTGIRLITCWRES